MCKIDINKLLEKHNEVSEALFELQAQIDKLNIRKSRLLETETAIQYEFAKAGYQAVQGMLTEITESEKDCILDTLEVVIYNE